MKYPSLLAISLLLVTQGVYADSIYKCTQKNGQITFTDKPCDKIKSKVLFEENVEKSQSKNLKNKTATISRLIRLGKNVNARRYAKKHQLEAVYQEEFEAYNLYLEQQIKLQALAAKKQEQEVKKQQLLMQQQSLFLQQQQIEQQRLQSETDRELAQSQKKRSRNFYYSPYGDNRYSTYSPYTTYSPYSSSTSTRRNCVQQGFGRRTCNQSSYSQRTIRNGVNVRGNVSIQLKDESKKIGGSIHGSF